MNSNQGAKDQIYHDFLNSSNFLILLLSTFEGGQMTMSQPSFDEMIIFHPLSLKTLFSYSSLFLLMKTIK